MIKLAENQKLVVITVWDKDPKRWYNYNLDKEAEKEERHWWIEEKFEKYKQRVAETISTAGKERVIYRRFVLTYPHYNKDFWKKYEIKDFAGAKDDLFDKLYTGGDREPQKVKKSFAVSYFNKYPKFADELGPAWLLKCDDQKEFYFYCNSKKWQNIGEKDRPPERDWSITLGEHFIKKYHTSPQDMILVAPEVSKIEEYLKGPSTDFTLFGIQEGDNEPDWLFCIGVELSPQREALLLKYAFKNVNTAGIALKNYLSLYELLKSVATKYTGENFMKYLQKKKGES